jgi:glycosyltransferase involved in cell wall biosynthesis
VKIVWMVPDLGLSGRSRAVCELSAQLLERGYEVEILYPRGRREVLLPPGVRATACGVELDAPLSSMLLNLPALILNTPACEWIICAGPPTPLAGIIAGRLRHARVLVYATGDERTNLDYRQNVDSNGLLGGYRHLADFTHGLGGQYISNSSWTATRLRHGRGRECPIIPYGVNPAVFNPDGPRMSREDLFTIITLGTPDQRKGLADLIEALNRVAGEDSGRRFQLWVIARGELDLAAAKFPLSVIGAATDRDLAAALRAADLLVYPSWAEGFGLPPLEAMACGTPVVSTDCGGVSEYARHNVNCLLVPPRDPSTLARSVALCMEDRGLLSRLSGAGLETAARFTWRRAALSLESILKYKA